MERQIEKEKSDFYKRMKKARIAVHKSHRSHYEFEVADMERREMPHI